MENKEKVLKMLNEALAQEHACQIRYLTHAAVLTGPYAAAVATQLTEIAEDEKLMRCNCVKELRHWVERQQWTSPIKN